MRADKICAYEKGKVRLESCEVKPPGENEVLIKTLFSTISPGTELAWLNHMENTPGEYPYYPGISCCGRLEEAGSGVRGLAAGDLVVCNQIHCSRFTADAQKCTKIPEKINPQGSVRIQTGLYFPAGNQKGRYSIGG